MTTAAPRATEREWQKTLIEAMGVYGWAVQHVYPLQTKHGWRTGTTASGWPDLVALRGMWLLAVEVKGTRTAVDDEQLAWLARFANLPCCRAWILRPEDDWTAINRWLRDPGSAPRRHGWDMGRAAAAVGRLERRERGRHG